ncbi:MAG: yidC [Parachlamydiales bacterium]|nr:yidC [Parachlamydiales bacterium]
MDKRSLLFIACVSLAFFGIQAWFEWGNKDSKPAPQQTSQQVATEAPVVQQTQRLAAKNTAKGEEQLYVLENEYQQLVFSSRGGSLAEINLPLKTGKTSKSLVKEIGFDRLIVKDDPANAHFPSQPAYQAGSSNISEGTIGGYYPLLRRSIYQADGTVRHLLDPQYYAMNIVSDDSEISSLEYRVTRFEKNLIQFEASQAQRRIIKTFTIPEERNGPYCFEASIQIEGDARGLWLSSGVPEAEMLSGSFSPMLRYQIMRNNTADVETIDLSDKNPVMIVTSVSPHWISNSNGFLGLIMDPLTDIASGYRAAKIPGATVPTRMTVIDAAYQPYPADKFPGYSTYLPLKSGAAQTFRVFAGPFDDTLLKELDELYDDPLKGYNPDYADAQSIQGWFSFISQPFSKFLYLLLKLFYTISGSWGFSIILLTIALRLMMYPLNNWSIKSTVRMQEMAPKVKAIQDRFKKDPKKGQLEVMNLYRQEGINPFGGCFPMLLQMPFLIGMFYLLKSTFPLRGASFIPGWIDNLAAPDVLFSWGYPIFMIGNEFHLLPIILGATMFLQQKMTSKMPKDEKDLSDSQKQQKMMGNIMSIVFTVMFYGFPSGLNIYFISSTLLGILQQWYLTKKMKEEALTVKK